jgi:cytochrome c-type biogenesis CcmH protein
VNLAAVVGGVILIGLVALALYRRNNPPAPPGAVAPSGSGATDAPMPPEGGAPITATVPVRLSPEASIIAERYRCVCSCNDPLSECTCAQKPGSNDMKSYVQELVDQKKTGREIDEAMVARYGAAALLSNPPAAARASQP